MLRILALLGLMMTSACATITTGTSQPITVTSEPAQAVCQMQRGGEVVGAVSATPATVTVSRSSRDISLRCERPGYQPGVTTVAANFQAMTLGNLLIGGLVGIAVDAASGAIGEYPGNVHVTLPPSQPASGDSPLAARRREITTQADDRIAAVRASCTDRPTRGGAASSCDMAVNAINMEREAQLRLLQEPPGAMPRA
ncbi:hypothetical protein EJV46_08395 [Roseococcus sp. SYP-B2431]|uniref:hypothetical protein n=1 Tax=Roseococcus sp. SYP-B2431 TaxID=2496640 RepID=UPI00103CCD1D|nr:hypothetical protein [Roseococcus sp. SYP-B2431]TCH98589.1 hypothetical protein EJV46_08395 [Roseococcus sp. SYP-B2431]